MPARRKFRIDTAREALKVDMLTSFESVVKFALIFESEIEEMVTMSWSIVTPKVKSINGNPKGMNGKDGKGSDSKGKKGKGEKGKGKTEQCFSSQSQKKVVGMDNSAQGITGR